MPVPYPQEFRDDVVRVALNREKGVTLAQIAKDFGVHEMTLSKWIRQAAIEDGIKPDCHLYVQQSHSAAAGRAETAMCGWDIRRDWSGAPSVTVSVGPASWGARAGLGIGACAPSAAGGWKGSHLGGVA